jgi:hypothetical protein
MPRVAPFCSIALLLAGDGRWPLGLTGRDGQIALAPPRGEGPLAILAEDGAGYEGRFPAGGERQDQPAVVTVPGRARLAGRVVDLRTRRPLSGALVWWEIEPARFARAGADGSSDFSLPALGSRWARAGAAGYLPERDHGGAAAATPRPYTFALAPAARLQGTGGTARAPRSPAPSWSRSWTSSARHAGCSAAGLRPSVPAAAPAAASSCAGWRWTRPTSCG